MTQRILWVFAICVAFLVFSCVSSCTPVPLTPVSATDEAIRLAHNCVSSGQRVGDCDAACDLAYSWNTNNAEWHACKSAVGKAALSR